MSQGYVVLAPNTPPDASKVVGIFLAGATQGLNTALVQATEFRDEKVPTGTIQPCSIDTYNTSVPVNS